MFGEIAGEASIANLTTLFGMWSPEEGYYNRNVQHWLS